jgi:hypothetical protein
MLMYSAVTEEYLFDCLADRLPSLTLDIVFWRETGWKEEEEALDARDGVCNMVAITPCVARRSFVNPSGGPGQWFLLSASVSE